MIKVKEICKKNKNCIFILITIIISCLMYWNYLKGHFGAETYAIANNYKNYGTNVYLVDGRIFSYLLMLVADMTNISILSFTRITCFIAIVFATLAVYKLKNSIVNLIEVNDFQEIIVWITSYCTIFNFMLVEILYFPESCIMVLSILLYILSSDFLIKKRYVCSLLTLIVAIFCYQGTIGFFIVCSIVLSLVKNKKVCKEVFKDIIRIILIGIIASGMNLIFIKVISTIYQLKQHKVFSFNTNQILENIKSIFGSSIYILQTTLGYFPKYLMLIFISIILIFILYIMEYEKNKKSGLVIFLILITIASSFVLFIIQRGSLYTGRVHFCIGSLIGISLLFIYSYTNIRYERILEKIFLIILAIYFIINFINTIQLVTEHQMVNYLEKKECIRIENIINEHERVNEVDVDKMVAIPILNQTKKGFFAESKRNTIVTYNNTRHYFGYTAVIRYYLEQSLKNIKMNSESNIIYKEYIEKEELEFGDIVCIDDTLYCPQYIF